MIEKNSITSVGRKDIFPNCKNSNSIVEYIKFVCIPNALEGNAYKIHEPILLVKTPLRIFGAIHTSMEIAIAIALFLIFADINNIRLIVASSDKRANNAVVT